MIRTATELNIALHQLTSFADMLEALRLDAEASGEWALFSHLSKGYFVRIHELNDEIREYLQENDLNSRSTEDPVLEA